MKAKDFLYDYIKIADIHASRLTYSLHKIECILPLTPNAFMEMSQDNTAYLDMMTTRFSRLQDTIGSKIFPLILDILGEDAVSFIDKLNRLEKLGIIDNASWWMTLRSVSNQITHDYPDDYDVLSEHFKTIIPVIKDLLELWDALKIHIHKLI